MALDIKDGNSAAATLKSTLDGADHLIHHVTKGGVADNAAETESPVPVAGKAVTSASYAPAYTDADRATLAIDKASGGILCHTRSLALSTDFVSAGGDIAHDAADTGLPIKIGGQAVLFEYGPTAVTTGDRVNAWFDLLGRQVVKIGGKDFYTSYSSAARTATPTASAAYAIQAIRGITVWVKVTAVTATPSVVLTIQSQNPIDGLYATMFTFNAVTAVGESFFKVYPGITGVAGEKFNDIMPRNFKLQMTHGNADSITYIVGFESEM